MKLGYIGIDNYNNYYHIKKYPRKELLQQLGFKYAQKMFVDTKKGKTKHIGYIIGGHWINVYEIHEWAKYVKFE
jgi:hypothetical protein